jgi:hypothetical protein
MPYTEQTSIYDDICKDGWEKAMMDTSVSGDEARHRLWWDKLSEDVRKMYGSVPIYKCPTRRSGPQYSTDVTPGDGSDNNIPHGPTGDYAVATLIRNPAAAPGACNWHSYYDSNTPSHYEPHFGPLRVSLRTGTNVNSCVPRDTFARWEDGSSNQIVIGEKHIPIQRINQCKNEWWEQTECTIFTANYRSGQGGVRHMHPQNRLARGPDDFITDDPAGASVGGYGFGSYHPGSCQFLMGDGTVRSFTVMTELRTILCPLTDVSDGVTVGGP